MRKYGGRCARCGYTDERALQFNHKNGDGYLHRVAKFHRSRTGLKAKHDPREWLRFLFDAPIQADIELLCANCNQIYEYERGFRKGPPPEVESYNPRIYQKSGENKPATTA